MKAAITNDHFTGRNNFGGKCGATAEAFHISRRVGRIEYAIKLIGNLVYAHVLLIALLAAPVYAAEPEDKDLLILRLKRANLEFALENMNLQAEIMKGRYETLKRDLEKISAELEAKEKKGDEKK